MAYVIGDIHRNFGLLGEMINDLDIRNEAIFQVGDFGVGFDPESERRALSWLDSLLSGRGCVMHVIRGNHDDPSWFAGDNRLGNLRLEPDYTVVESGGLRYLLCGGATSIDRAYLRDRMLTAEVMGARDPCYWESERFSHRPHMLEGVGRVDVVVTHTAPEWCHPDATLGFGQFVKRFFESDPRLEHDLRTERMAVSSFFRQLEESGAGTRAHFYGHFHESRVTVRSGVTHRLLGIGECARVEDFL